MGKYKADISVIPLEYRYCMHTQGFWLVFNTKATALLHGREAGLNIAVYAEADIFEKKISASAPDQRGP